MSALLRVCMDTLSAGREPLEDGFAAWGGRGLVDRILAKEVPPPATPSGKTTK